MVRLSNTFSFASRLHINWKKSIAFWHSTIEAKPTWLDMFMREWAQEGELSKLVGTMFGLSLEVHDVDNFLIKMLQKKTTYWRSRQLLSQEKVHS